MLDTHKGLLAIEYIIIICYKKNAKGCYFLGQEKMVAPVIAIIPALRQMVCFLAETINANRCTVEALHQGAWMYCIGRQRCTAEPPPISDNRRGKDVRQCVHLRNRNSFRA